jgi:hypothetical protein
MPGCNDGVTYEERLRDEFALAAMCALMDVSELVMCQVAKTAWDMANAMLEAREADRQRREAEAAVE